MLHRIIDIIQKAIDSSDAKAALLIEAVRADTAEARNRQLEAMYREAIKQSVSLGRSNDKLKAEHLALRQDRREAEDDSRRLRIEIGSLREEISALTSGAPQDEIGRLTKEIEELIKSSTAASCQIKKLEANLKEAPKIIAKAFEAKAGRLVGAPVYPIGGVEVPAQPLLIWISRRVWEAAEGGAEAIQGPAFKP